MMHIITEVWHRGSLQDRWQHRYSIEQMLKVYTPTATLFGTGVRVQILSLTPLRDCYCYTCGHCHV